MKYIKLYEEFKYDELEIIEPEVNMELPSDVLESEEVYRDENGVYHIKNWTVY
jgi:hypothetical protein